MHNTTRGRSLGQNGSQVRFRENVGFGPFSWLIAHNFHQSGQFFRNIPDVHKHHVEDIGGVFIDFWTVGYTFRAFFGPFRCLCNWELLAQTEAKMMHFVTLTVPPPLTDHSLMPNTTRGRSPGQKGSQVRFRKNVHIGSFSWVLALDFHQPGQFFRYIPHVQKLLIKDMWRGFHWFLDRRAHISGIFRPI
jgi:hypothetical protein